jgi:CDP-diacylglycerol--glycerol-3-phosphate 3-phosphatidyltransferase
MESYATPQDNRLHALQVRWFLTGLGTLALLAAAYWLLASGWEAAFAGRWLAGALAASLYLLWTFWRHLPHNHPLNQPAALYADLGLPNRVTYWRGFLVACTAGFLLTPRPAGSLFLLWLPGLLFSFGILPDFVDGLLARLTGRGTRLGEHLDEAVDSLAVLTGTLLVVLWGQVPVWYLLVGLARYLYLAGLWLRRRLGKPIHALPPSLGRRALAGTQMGLLMVLLWPLFSPPGTSLAATLFAVPFLLNFGRDWLYAAGLLQTTQPVSARPPGWLSRWLPLLLRGLVVLGVASVCLPWLSGLPAITSYFSALGVLFPGLLVGLLLALQTWVMLSAALGVMGRTIGILALCLAGFYLRFDLGLPAVNLITALCGALLLFLGSGRLSLWQPEEELLQRRIGEAA